jgi:hypothetical protein
MRSRFQLLTAMSVALWCFVFIGPSPQAWAQVGPTFYFPHLANGDTGNGIWQTNFVFVNNSPFDTQGTLYLYDDNGAALVLATTTLGSASKFNISIPAHGTFEIETTGAGSVQGGWARADFDDAVIGSAMYSLTTGQGKMVSVGVPSLQAPMESFSSPATDRTGIALTNIFDSSNTVELLAIDPSGNLVASTELTLGPGHHIAANLANPPLSVPTGFRGSLMVYSVNSYIAAMAIGVESNSALYVCWSYSNIAYDSLRTAYSGTFNLIGGPDAGGGGTVEASNLEHFDSSMFTGNISTTLSGLVRNGVFLGTSDDFGLAYMFYLVFQGASNRGLAIGELQSNGNFEGFIVDDGEGNYGTFTLSPKSGSGFTLRAPSKSRPPKKDLGLWRRLKARQ